MEELQLHPQIKTEAAKGRTYGECVMDEIMSIQQIRETRNGYFCAYNTHRKNSQSGDMELLSAAH
jgi:hypothetical protein